MIKLRSGLIPLVGIVLVSIVPKAYGWGCDFHIAVSGEVARMVGTGGFRRHPVYLCREFQPKANSRAQPCDDMQRHLDLTWGSYDPDDGKSFLGDHKDGWTRGQDAWHAASRATENGQICGTYGSLRALGSAFHYFQDLLDFTNNLDNIWHDQRKQDVRYAADRIVAHWMGFAPCPSDTNNCPQGPGNLYREFSLEEKTWLLELWTNEVSSLDLQALLQRAYDFRIEQKTRIRTAYEDYRDGFIEYGELWNVVTESIGHAIAFSIAGSKRMYIPPRQESSPQPQPQPVSCVEPPDHDRRAWCEYGRCNRQQSLNDMPVTGGGQEAARIRFRAADYMQGYQRGDCSRY